MTPPARDPNLKTAADQIDHLVAAINRVGSPACVGIDPAFDLLPRSLRLEGELEAIKIFSLGVLDCIAGAVPAVKPQSACFERYGSKGYAILEQVIARARELGFVVILDAKRGDIGSSATHYARGAADMGANFITVSPYMGPSSIDPFLAAGLGVFALARTSNPDSDEIQMRPLEGSTPESNLCVTHAVSGMIAKMGSNRLGKSGLSALGAVVGATKSADEVAVLRGIMSRQMLLVPGVGAQGGTMNDVRPMTRSGARTLGELGVIVNASRSVLYAQPIGDASWMSTVRDAAIAFAHDARKLMF